MTHARVCTGLLTYTMYEHEESINLCELYSNCEKLNLDHEFIITFSIGCRTNLEMIENPESIVCL